MIVIREKAKKVMYNWVLLFVLLRSVHAAPSGRYRPRRSIQSPPTSPLHPATFGLAACALHTTCENYKKNINAAW